MIQTPDFADRLAATQDQILECSEDELSTGRRRFLAVATTPTPANRRIWVVVPVVACAAAATLVVAYTGNNPTLTATSNGVELLSGTWISSSDETAAIDFSDGTHVRLAEQSQVRLTEMNDFGAHLLLERGSAELDVVHTENADWSIAAGPFTVEVTGTQFGAEWSPERQELVVRMREGSVFVTGPHLEGGQRVTDVGTLSVSLFEGQYRLSSGPMPEAVEKIALDEASVVEPVVEAPLRVQRRSDAVVPKPVTVNVVTWKQLASEGNYAESLGLAQDVGVDTILQRSNSTDLYLFGDMARLAGDHRLAATAFESLRNRFPGTRYSTEASFVLGKMAYDHDADYRGAARWFQAHLEESPDGRSADDAMGLLMLSYDRVGDRPATRAAAKAYLERFPSGKSARQAKNFSKRR